MPKKLSPAPVNPDPVESGEWVDPYNTKKPDRKKEAEKIIKSNKKKLESLGGKEERLDQVLKKASADEVRLLLTSKNSMREAFVGSNGIIDFKSNRLEKAIGLKDMFGKETPLILIRDKNENARYAERKENGHYYYVGTSKRALVYTGDSVEAPKSKAELLAWKKDSVNDLDMDAEAQKQMQKNLTIDHHIETVQKRYKNYPKEGLLLLEMVKVNEEVENLVRKIIKAKGLKNVLKPENIVKIHQELVNPKSKFASFDYKFAYNHQEKGGASEEKVRIAKKDNSKQGAERQL